MTAGFRFAAWLLILNASGTAARAHSMHQSAVLLDFQGNAVKAELQLPIDRLSISFRRTVDEQHFPDERAALAAYVLDHVHPMGPDRRPFSVHLVSMKIETVEQAPYLVAHLTLTPPAGLTAGLFTLNYDVISHEIVTHVVLVSIRSDSTVPVPPDDPYLVGMIRGERKSLTIDRRRP